MKSKLEKNIIQTIIERKLSLFGHICKMNDNRLIKTTVFVIMNDHQKEEDQRGSG